MSCRIGGLQTGEWFRVWPKVLWNVYEASLSHRQGGGGACSASSSDPHVISWRKSKLDGETWPSHGVSPCLTLKSFFTDNFENWKSWFKSLKGRQMQSLMTWETLININHVSGIKVFFFFNFCVNSFYIYNVIFFLPCSIGGIYKETCILGYMEKKTQFLSSIWTGTLQFIQVKLNLLVHYMRVWGVYNEAVWATRASRSNSVISYVTKSLSCIYAVN